ncbi:MAG: insulinase family protein [Phycisphaerales bacterium]|nr:insulinase family protein [Phycisphaerales bacterium]
MKITQNTRISSLTRTILIAATLSTVSFAKASDRPSHPSEIVFEELNFTPPKASDYRHELSNGVPVFIAESSEFPLVTIRFSFKGGEYMVPADKAGLGALTGALMRSGGSASMTPDELDEEFDFLAANVSAGIGDRTASASINCLTSNLDDAFALFMDMIRNPRFDEDRIEITRGQILESLESRNDAGVQIAIRELGFLMWGDEHFEGRQPTRESIESITVEDMRNLHERIFHPGNMMIAVTGDVETKEILTFLENTMSGWPTGEVSPDIPTPTQAYEPGVYYYEKDQPQVQVLIAHRGIERDNEDAIDVEVMNQILGGSGFTSRITNTVRTQEGLAYTAGSVFSNRIEYPGMFMSYFFTKTSTTALATRLVFDEIDKIQTEEATTEEIEIIQNSLIETFPRNFESKSAMMGLFMSDERTGRDEDYWQNYRDRVRAVSAADVQQAALNYLNPEQAVIMVVGPVEEIKKGNAETEADSNRIATMDEFFGGQFKIIPERDPESLKPVDSE